MATRAREWLHDENRGGGRVRVKIRQDLQEQGLGIPCQYQEGAYLLPYEVEGAEYLGEVKEGKILLLLPYENGIRSLVVVDSIDLDFINEEVGA